MNTVKPKIPLKGAGKRLKENYEKRRKQSKPTSKLLEILNDPEVEQLKKSARDKEFEA